MGPEVTEQTGPGPFGPGESGGGGEKKKKATTTTAMATTAIMAARTRQWADAEGSVGRERVGEDMGQLLENRPSPRRDRYLLPVDDMRPAI